MKITVVEPGFEIETPIEHIRVMPQLIERAGRTCYKSEDKITQDSAEKFVRGIVASGHESVIEHANITVKIIGDRSMSHQLVRHRIAAYSQESQRYCDYGKLGLQVICPPSITKLQPGTYERCDGWAQIDEDHRLVPGALAITARGAIWLNTIGLCYRTYLDLRDEGIKPQDARSVLPNAVKTEVVTTFNLRQWRHVFDERALNPRAQWQIRGIMLSILEEFAKLLPCAFQDMLDAVDDSLEGEG